MQFKYKDRQVFFFNVLTCCFLFFFVQNTESIPIPCRVLEPNRCLPDPHSCASPPRLSLTPPALLKMTRWSLACNVSLYLTISPLLRHLAGQRNLFPQFLPLWTSPLTRPWTMMLSSLLEMTVVVWYPILVRNLLTSGMVCKADGVLGTVDKSIMPILKGQYPIKGSNSSSQRKSTNMSLRKAFFHSKGNRISICRKRHGRSSRIGPNPSSDAPTQVPQAPTINQPSCGCPIITRTPKTWTNLKSLLVSLFPPGPSRQATTVAGQQRSPLGHAAMMTDLLKYPLENLCPATCPVHRAPRASLFTSTGSCRLPRALPRTPNT